MVTSEWKMTDQQGKKNLSRIFRCILEIFPWFSAISGERQKLLYGNQWWFGYSRNLSHLFDENRHRINLWCHLKLATLMTHNIKWAKPWQVWWVMTLMTVLGRALSVNSYNDLWMRFKNGSNWFNSLFFLWVLEFYFNFFNLYVRWGDGSSASSDGCASNVDLLVSVDKQYNMGQI